MGHNTRPETHRRERADSPSVRSWKSLPADTARQLPSAASLDCGWGRLLFGHTFEDPMELIEAMREEKPGQRDIALYLRDPHVVVSLAPQEVFLDPSYTYRLALEDYRAAPAVPRNFVVRRLQSLEDAEAVRRIYQTRHMVPVAADFMWNQGKSRRRAWFVAEDCDGEIVGTVMGVDHTRAIDDPEGGSSLWCLAVDPQCSVPGVGEALVRYHAEHYQARGCRWVDLSVMHDNHQAIALYEKIGYQRVPVFCVKTRSTYNEPLYATPGAHEEFNPYATIILDEARRRGIGVEPIDPAEGYFRLRHGGRAVLCRESLSELTSAVAMSRCADKLVTSRVLKGAGLRVPEQLLVESDEDALAFLERHGRVVVKPRDGEQGRGVSVDIRDADALVHALGEARGAGNDVLIEAMCPGHDLRIVVIDGAVVAAAVREPARVVGTGRHTVRELIERQSRRRSAATQGESSIPLDEETRRCIEEAGHTLDTTLPVEEPLRVRGAANLHTGGTIHDVTADLHPRLAEVAIEAATALDIPVAGLDLLVPDVGGEEYVILEVNERPGLANHEPQPTAERFVDFLFPQTVPRS